MCQLETPHGKKREVPKVRMVVVAVVVVAVVAVVVVVVFMQCHMFDEVSLLSERPSTHLTGIGFNIFMYM